MRVLSERGGCFPLFWMPTVRQRTSTSWDRELDHLTPFGKTMWSIITKNHFFFFFFFLLNTGGMFVTNIRKFSKDRYWNFITMSYRTICWLKIRILEAAPVLPVNPSHINSTAEVTVNATVCWLPPNHGSSKLQTTLLALGPLMQTLGACLAYHVWHKNFFLISKFNIKISKVSTLYKTCDWTPVKNNSVFATDVAEYVGTSFARSSGWRHFIYL